jgi:ATP-dependent HslUV protease ATP-binding subunit HslU
MIEDLTPSQIVAELDKYIVGQNDAKRAVAVALRNRYRRRRLSEDLRDEVIPKNILMIGPTGVGKTEIARRLAKLARAPFIKVEATKFTEVGYVGRDVDSMVRDLAQAAVRMLETEKLEEVQDEADERAIERIVDIMQPVSARRSKREEKDSAEAFRQTFGNLFGGGIITTPPATVPKEEDDEEDEEEEEARRREREERIRRKLRESIKAGARDDEKIEVEVESASPHSIQGFSPQGMEEMIIDFQNLGNMLNKQKKQRTVTVKEAKQILAQDEAKKLLDHESIVRDAVERAEQSGIIFVDEIDKIAGRTGGSGPDVSREGVQRDILPIIEGSTVTTKYGPIRTNHILFIAAGAFHVSKPSDLIPELQGRLPIRVELESLTESDFRRILTEPKNALVRQYIELLATEGVRVEFTEDAIDELSAIAARVNQQAENIGARRLHTVLERTLEELSFQAPDHAPKEVKVDAAYVREKLESISKDEDLSRYIL